MTLLFPGRDVILVHVLGMMSCAPLQAQTGWMEKAGFCSAGYKGIFKLSWFSVVFLTLFIQVSNFNKQHDPVWASGHRLGKAFLTSGHVTTKSIGKSTLARGPHSNTKSFLLINPRLKNLISEQIPAPQSRPLVVPIGDACAREKESIHCYSTAPG